MTVEINLLAALKRVRHTKEDDPQKAETQAHMPEVAKFKDGVEEHGKQFTSDSPLKSFVVKGRE